jgi:hypothetical protein
MKSLVLHPEPLPPGRRVLTTRQDEEVARR